MSQRFAKSPEMIAHEIPAVQFTPEDPDVSVILSVFNGALYVKDAMESILNQSFGNFEFIIMDDASTDDTWSILSAYKAQDRRIMLLQNETNRGLTESLNRCISLAKGKYIARMDADDICLPGRLSAQVEYLETHGEIGIIGMSYYRLFTNGEQSLRTPPVSDSGIRWQLLFDNVWCHSSVMFRRELLEEGVPCYRPLRYSQDYELWTRLLRQTRGASLTTPGVIYRSHDDSGISVVHREQQKSLAACISLQQLENLLHPEEISASEAESLRRCYRGRGLTFEDLVAAKLIFKIFDAFRRRNGYSTEVVRKIQRNWIRRIFNGIQPQQWLAFWKSGFVSAVLTKDFRTFLLVLFKDLPKRILRYWNPRKLQP